MKIRSLLIASLLPLALASCSKKEDEPQRLGFSSAQEMEVIQAKGWHTKKRYVADETALAKRAGFSSMDEMQTAESAGYNNKVSWDAYQKNKRTLERAAADRSAADKATRRLLDEFFDLDHDSDNVIVLRHWSEPGSLTREQHQSYDAWTKKKANFAVSIKGKQIADVECVTEATFDVSESGSIGCYSGTGNITAASIVLNDYWVNHSVFIEVQLAPENAKLIGTVYKNDKFLIRGTIDSVEFVSDDFTNYLEGDNRLHSSKVSLVNGSATLEKN